MSGSTELISTTSNQGRTTVSRHAQLPFLAGSGQTILSTNGQSLLLCTPGYDPVDQAGGLRQQHDVHTVGAVGTERHGLLDVGGARRTGHEVDCTRHVSKFGAQ